MITFNQQFQNKKQKFLNRVNDNLRTEKISKKLGLFYNHSFKVFLSELKKDKIKLSLADQDEWEEYFSDYKNAISKIQIDIANTEKYIDQMVYELYELTDDEIKIIEAD